MCSKTLRYRQRIGRSVAKRAKNRNGMCLWWLNIEQWKCQMNQQRHQQQPSPFACMWYMEQSSIGATTTTKNIRYLPTPFICGAINNIEINYRLKLTVINHFIFIISSSFRLFRFAVRTARGETPFVHDICVLRAANNTVHRVLLKNITALVAAAAAAAISRSNFISAPLPRGEWKIISTPLAYHFAVMMSRLQRSHDAIHQMRTDEESWNRRAIRETQMKHILIFVYYQRRGSKPNPENQRLSGARADSFFGWCVCANAQHFSFTIRPFNRKHLKFKWMRMI